MQLTFDPPAKVSSRVQAGFDSQNHRVLPTSCPLQDAIAGHAYPQIRYLTIEIDQSNVCIYGEVDSFFAKQLAQECLRPLLQGMTLQNRVHVRSE